MRRLTMKKIKDILQLKYITELSYRQISRGLNVPSSTISDYCKRFEITTHDIDTFLAKDEDDIYKILFPEKKLPRLSKERPLPDVEYIHKEIAKKGVTFELLWQEYKEMHPNGYGCSQFKEYYYRYKRKLNPSMRQTYIPGEKLFIDYSGLTVPVVDSKTGKIHKAQIFVCVLGASGYTFVHATHSQKKEDFILSHVLAYEFFGGVPKINVPDNLKSAIISNNRNGIVVNENYAELARHYNCTIEPARPRKPQDKGMVEQGVQAIQRWILAVLRDRTFFSVDELNDAISTLLDRYNNKVIKRLNKSRNELFEENDKPYLQTLPANRFMYKEFKIATVNIDYHVELLKCFYSVPFKYLKEKVEIRYSTTVVEIYHKSRLIATHPRLYRPNDTSTFKEHMPLNHQYQHEKMNPQRLKNWAVSIGTNASVFVTQRLETAEYPTNAYRGIIAILSLEKMYGRIALNLALGYANSINTTSVKSIRSILDKKLYLQAVNTHTVKPSTPTHENIRGSEYYK
jgi:transposase